MFGALGLSDQGASEGSDMTQAKRGGMIKVEEALRDRRDEGKRVGGLNARKKRESVLHMGVNGRAPAMTAADHVHPPLGGFTDHSAINHRSSHNRQSSYRSSTFIVIV